MIGISTQISDLNGFVVIKESADSVLGNHSARVNRVKALDGGVVINHNGFWEGDRTFDIRAEISKEQETTILYIFKNYRIVNIATPQGFFVGAIETCDANNGELSMTLLIKEKK